MNLDIPEMQILARPTGSCWAAGLLPAIDRSRAHALFEHVERSFNTPVKTELFIQVWKLGGSPAGAEYGRNIQRWKPVNGMGVEPDGRPPQRLTEEIAMDIAAAGLVNEEPPLASHPVAHVSGGEEAVAHAVNALFGSGVMLQMWFSARDHAGWAQRTKAVYQPTVDDPLFQRERFYTPLLTPTTAEQASDDELGRWLCGATVYMRETPGVKGVLLLWREAFGPHS